MSKKGRVKVSERLRAAMAAGPMSRYAISKELGIDEGQLSRFMNHKGGLSMENIDAIAELLDLELVARRRPRVKKGR